MRNSFKNNECLVCNLCEESVTFLLATTIPVSIPSVARRFSKEKFTVWRCASCQSLHSKEAVDLNRYYEAYAVKNHVLNFATRLAYHNRLRLLRKFGLQKHQTILDFGCGAGLFIRFLKEKGYKAFGYDAFVKEFRCEETLNETYDYVVSYDVIEHDDNPKSFFQHLSSRVNPEGTLVVGTPNAAAIRFDRLDLYFMPLHQPYHRHILSEAILIRMAKQEDFNLIHVQRRSDWDTLIPFHNARFYWTYCSEMRSVDALIEPPNLQKIIFNPKLIFNAFLGYFFPTQESITAIFKKHSFKS